MIGRLAYVTGRVQGVGFRNFVQREARKLGVSGYAKNLGDGRVEVLALGDGNAVIELLGLVAKGPRWADVRHCEVRETPMLNLEGFEIR
jgi:acylphosphatase